MPSKKNIRLGSGPVFIILIIALVAAAGFGAWRYYKYKLVNQEVKKGIYENSNGLYKVTYDNLKIDEAAGFLYVTNLVITPDTALFRKMIKENKNPPLILRVTIPELKVTGVKTPKALLEKNIEGSKLEIKSPDILIYFARRPTDSVKRPDSREMYEQILGNLKRIKVDSVEITNSSLAFADIRTETKTITGENINIHLRDILIDSTSFEDKTRFFFAKIVDVDLEKGVLKNKTGTYQYLFDAVSFSNTQRTFTVKKVHIKPVLGEAAFVKKARLQTDRFDFIFNDVSFKNIDLDKLMDESFYADTLIVRDANVKIFRDLSYPRDKVDRRGGYPQQMLMKMDLPVAIKKLIFRSAFIEYKEFNPKSDYNGRVQFQRASASISNVTNIKSEIAQNNNLLINFNAHFLNFAPMHATINMKLGDPRGRFTASGGMSKFDATRLNVLLKPAALAQVDKGTVNKLTFSLNADDNNSNGQLVMLYEDLKLTILKKDSAENKLQKKKFASFLGNMVIKNANPSGRKDPRKATIQYQRDPNRSFFNLIWKSIFVGVKESVGVPSN